MRLMAERNLRIYTCLNRDLLRSYVLNLLFASSLNCQSEKSWIFASTIALDFFFITQTHAAATIVKACMETFETSKVKVN
jgi:hypothetical protein